MTKDSIRDPMPDRGGLAFDEGAFHVDPVEPVATAVITHAHSDHARRGHGTYHATPHTSALLRERLGEDLSLVVHPEGEPFVLGRSTLSFHPAGHVLGSAQVRIATDEGVTVVSGDFKRAPDPTCAPHEVVPCDTFVTEATFALPIYRWPEPSRVRAEILAWWRDAARRGTTCVLFVYALGKAQRVLAELAPEAPGPFLAHGALFGVDRVYREAGIDLPPLFEVEAKLSPEERARALVLAPPSALGSPWMKRFPRRETGFASGWMRVRAYRRRRAVDRGFCLSDHADWPALLRTISETRASRVLVTHGRGDVLVRHLREQGLDARALATSRRSEEES